MAERVGVDVGGTFTDVVTIEDGRLDVTKVPSTPDAPETGVLDGIDTATVSPTQISYFGHGTTVGTNAVLERDWAKTALVTTEGFRDILEIGRQDRPDLYDLDAERPVPIVPRDRRFEVRERVGARGTVDTPLDRSHIEDVVAAIDEADVESVAICLLFAYEHDEHERTLANEIETARPTVHVSRSSAVLPEIREYERTLATALNAALAPVMDRYIGRLAEGLEEIDVAAPLRIMQSNGGITPAEQARQRPINTLLSGPAAGVQGAAYLAELAGYEDVITMDMGGTSCDVALVEGGDPVVSTDVSVGDYPVGVPMTEIHTIGAGGGSIAWLDAGGSLRVGPDSAGAEPGPICYGRGGTRPTVTDAHAALGRIDPTAFLPEEMDATVTRAREGIAREIADPLGMSVDEAAAGILRVANASMERAIRVATVERGHDPRTRSIVAFGGAGPLHATAIARRMEIPRVLIPKTAGVLSALGLVIADVLHDFSTSLVRPWDEIDRADLVEHFESFADEGRARLEADGFAPEEIAIERSLDMRYRGQSFTLQVPVDDLDTEAIGDRFHAIHERRYGHAAPEEPIELVTIRLRVRGIVEPPPLAATADAQPSTGQATTRDVHFDGEVRETSVVDRTSLASGAQLDGPAVVEGAESTILVHPGQTATVDQHGTIVVEEAT